ncbi:hypothetical protein HRbin37_01359 [bacterium HR37]|nr:hypothetical protein HRbin37_01359 [bacterium HR37]
MRPRNIRVLTPSGELGILMRDIRVEGKFLVLEVQMGVWSSKLYFGLGDIFYLIKVFSAPFFLVLLRTFLSYLPFGSKWNS